MALVPANGIVAQAFSATPQAADTAALGALTAAALTVADGAGTNDGTIGAITADASVIAAVQEIAAQVNKIVTDLATLKTKVDLIRTNMRAAGLMA